MINLVKSSTTTSGKKKKMTCFTALWSLFMGTYQVILLEELLKVEKKISSHMWTSGTNKQVLPAASWYKVLSVFIFFASWFKVLSVFVYLLMCMERESVISTSPKICNLEYIINYVLLNTKQYSSKFVSHNWDREEKGETYVTVGVMCWVQTNGRNWSK